MRKVVTSANGFEWNLSFTFGSLKKIKALTGHDLGRPFAGTDPLAARINDDPTAVIEIVGACVHDQRPDVTYQAWLDRALPGDVPTMRAALIGELADFFRAMKDDHAASLIELSATATVEGRKKALAAMTSMYGEKAISSPA